MKNEVLNFHKLNIKWFVAGIFLLILGYILMGWTSAGGTYEETVFGSRKLTVAPIILLLGYGFIGVSVMNRKKNEV